MVSCRGHLLTHRTIKDPTIGFKVANPGCPTCSSGIVIAGCPCPSSPVTIHMTSSEPASNNGMFQNATLVYGPTPSALLPVILTPNSYLSTTTFSDPILGANFYYFLTCSYGAYVLTRVYPTSRFGSPFRDSIRYSWVPSYPGNSCSPFSLPHGQMYTGGDTSCIVSISG